MNACLLLIINYYNIQDYIYWAKEFFTMLFSHNMVQFWIQFASYLVTLPL